MTDQFGGPPAIDLPVDLSEVGGGGANVAHELRLSYRGPGADLKREADAGALARLDGAGIARTGFRNSSAD